MAVIAAASVKTAAIVAAEKTKLKDDFSVT